MHIEGFEQFGDSPSMHDALTRADYFADGVWAAVAGRLSPSYGISGRTASLMRKAPWAVPSRKFSVGFAFNMDSRGSVAHLKIGATEVTFWLHPITGMPMLNDGVGGALPTISRWYFYELEFDRDTGYISLFINNRFDSNLQVGGMIGTEVEVTLGYREPATYWDEPDAIDNSIKTYDDFYIHDGGRLGPISISTRFPTVDRNVQWFNTVVTSHAQTLSLRPPQPLDKYVAADTVGKEDRFVSTQPLANGNAVVATGLVVMARKSPTLNAKLGVFIGGTAGADLRSGVRTVESEWRTQYICFEQVIGDTPAGIAASEFGINVAAP